MDATRLTGLCIVYVLTRHVILNTLTTVYYAVMFVENKVFSSERTHAQCSVNYHDRKTTFIKPWHIIMVHPLLSEGGGGSRNFSFQVHGQTFEDFIPSLLRYVFTSLRGEHQNSALSFRSRERIMGY